MTALVLGLLAGVLPASAVLPPGPQSAPLPDFDVRTLDVADGATAPTSAQLKARQELQDELRSVAGGELVVRFGPQPGTLHHLFRRAGFLTAAPAGERDAEDIARQWIHAHRALLGLDALAARELHLARRLQDAGSGAVHLHFQQQYAGLRIFHAEVRVHLDAAGRILSIAGNTAPSDVLTHEWKLDATAALLAAARSVRVELQAAPTGTGQDAAGWTRWARGPFESAPFAAPTWFALDAGLVPAWQVIVDPVRDQGWYQVVVQAGTGAVLSRYDLVENVATEGLVFREDPGQGPQLVQPFVDDAVLTDPASLLGWSAAGLTQGNNCDVKDDIANDNETTDGRRATAAGPDPLAFAFPFQDDPAQDLDASLTNLFYLNNWLHDRLARLGFDEPAGNFQDDTFGRGGRGGDAVYVDAQDGGGRNNANFGTPPDGNHPRMQMYIWTRTNPNRDSGFDSSVVTHELFHGVSNRLVGGPDEAGCLGGQQGGAMGEAWSDFYACSFWDQVTVGGYLVNNYVRGIRRAAYDAYPFNYGQLCNQGGFEVHRDGEIWAATLWDIRELFIARDGYQAGKCAVERLVLDGMKLAPCRPTFVDMRDAILLAIRLSGGPGDECLAWQGFASRGLGLSAVSQTGCTSAADAASDVPPECAACALAAPVLVSVDATQPNRVTLSFQPAAGADEHVLLRSAAACGDNCAATTFEEVTRGAGDATELADVDSDGSRLSAGDAWSYRVMALLGTSCTSYSACAGTVVTGRCTLRPSGTDPAIVGVLALTRPPGATCSVQVTWAESTAACGGPANLRYNVYRSEDPAFTPGPEHLVGSVAAPLLSWRDPSPPPVDVTYVVRAEDLTTGGDGPHGGNEEANTAKLTLRPQGLQVGTTQFGDDAEGGELPGYRRTGSFVPNDWAVVSDGNTRGGSAWHVEDEEGGNADKNLHLPLLSLGSAPRLLFNHVYEFEDCFDGGVVEISGDGGLTWTDLINDITAGGYATSQSGCGGVSSTVGDMINAPNVDALFTGENVSGFGNWDAVEVDLAPYAGTLDAILRFRCLLDPLAAEPGGWYVDDLVVEDVRTFGACASACTDPPVPSTLVSSACRVSLADVAFAQLDASASVPGAMGFAAELAFVFTHDGPGSFAGRRFATGPVASLEFPPGTPVGSYPVTLTLRGADGCAATLTVQVAVEDEVLPPGPLGPTLRVAKDPAGLALSWQDVLAPLHVVHALPLGADLRTLAASAPVATLPGGALGVLATPAAQPGGGTLFLRVDAASTCGNGLP